LSTSKVTATCVVLYVSNNALHAYLHPVANFLLAYEYLFHFFHIYLGIHSTAVGKASEILLVSLFDHLTTLY